MAICGQNDYVNEKFLVTPLAIELATLRVEAQCHNQVRYCVLLQRESFVKYTKAHRQRCYGYVERIKNHSTPEQIAAVTVGRKKENRKTTCMMER
jgi:hypothetical protein